MVIKQDELKAIREFQIKELKHRDLQAVCSRPKTKGVNNALEDAMLKKIVRVYKSKERYGKLEDDVEIIILLTWKEPQCPYRFLNILFSDRFSEGLVQLGNLADQAELDAGKASNNQLFWEDIQE